MSSDDSDRLSYGEGPLGGPLPESEPEMEQEETTGSNRAFVFIAVAMGGLILLGILAGQMIYKWRQDIILTTVTTVVGSFIGIWLGTLGPVKNLFMAINGNPDATLFLGLSWSKILWSIVVMVICYFFLFLETRK